MPAGSSRTATLAFSMLLAAIHALEGLAWFAVLTAGLAHVRRWLTRPAIRHGLNRLTGVVLVGFGIRLAIEGRRLAAG